MSGFFRFWGRRYGQGVADTLKRSFVSVRTFIPFFQEQVVSEAEELRRKGAYSVLRLILSDERGAADEKKLEIFRHLLRGERSDEEVELHIREIRKIAPLPPGETALALGNFSDDERGKLMRFLLSLAAAAETSEPKIDELRQIFVKAGADENSFSKCREETLRMEERRRRIIGSGAGIAVALVVILVFVITASLLRSVIFGLILAYILLPMEKYFERRERKRSGLVYYLFRILSLPALPLQKLSQRIMRRDPSKQTREEQERRQERRIITTAVAQTVLVTLILVCGLVLLLTRLAAHYVGDIRNNAQLIRKSNVPAADRRDRGTGKTAAAAAKEPKPVAAPTTGGPAAVEKGKDVPPEAKQSADEDRFSKMVQWLNSRLHDFRSRLERNPFTRYVLDMVIMFLRDENSQKELLGKILKHSGGIFSFTMGVLSSIVVALTDLLLTVFFALLFLMKLAEFCRDDDSSGRKSEYLVRTVFNGNWLPGTNEVTVNEAKRILGGIMERLRIWVRGYATLVLVDASVYITVFFFLRVPYFPILGFIAGCGILLPYIGPVISASLTLLVTLAVGNCTGLQLAGIIAAYLIYNGIIEQFILYPAVIGDSLGLTTLETIIVVLLGAVLAGIPGMLLALPTASVLKYLIPQIIHYLRLRKSAREEAADAARRQ